MSDITKAGCRGVCRLDIPVGVLLQVNISVSWLFLFEIFSIFVALSHGNRHTESV